MPITVPGGVEVTLAGSHITVTGSLGKLERSLPPAMLIELNDGVISVRRPTETTTHRALHGLTRTLVANMVEGVSKGFTRQLDLVGVGFRAAKQGNDLVLSLGYSHPIRYTPPDGVAIGVPVPTQITVSGSNKEIVGQVPPRSAPSASRSRTRARA